MKMCAQYILNCWASELAQKYSVPIQEDSKVEFRALPYSPAIVVVENQTRQFQKMKFSLVPAWSEVPKLKFATHNARIETILQKPTWKQAILSQHCLIPMSEFVESVVENKYAGNMVKFSGTQGALLTAAGLWDRWTDPDTQEVLHSFTIITDEPSDFIRDVGHDRSPLFLKEEAFSNWLQPSKQAADTNWVEFLKHNRYHPELKVEIDRPLKAGWEKRK